MDIMHISRSPHAIKALQDGINSLFDAKLSPPATFIVAASDSQKKEYADYVCDGTDDDIQIQAAIDALPTSGGFQSGGKIILLEGTFNISNTIHLIKNLEIWGMGTQATTLKLTASSSHNMFDYAVNDSAEQVALVLRHFTADGNKSNSATGKFIDTKTSTGEIKDVIFEEIFIAYFGSTGAVFDIKNPWGVRMIRVIIEFNNGDAINVNAGTVAGSSQSFYMTNCKLRTNAGNGVVLNDLQSCHLVANEIDAGEGSDTSKWCIKLVNSGFNNIIGNTIQATGTRRASGILIDADSDSNVISNNQVVGGGVGVTGVELEAGASSNIVSGNAIVSYATNQILDAGTNTIKVGNSGAVATATTTVLPSKIDIRDTATFGDGGVANYAAFSSSGDLQFVGTAGLLVGSDRYVFQYSVDEDYGLFFDATNVRYEFRTSDASDIFHIHANTGIQFSKGFSRVSTQFDKTTDTTLSAITGLSAGNLLAGKTYQFEICLFVDADATGGVKFDLGGGVTATSIIYEITILDDSTDAYTLVSRGTSLGSAAGYAGTTAGICTIKGVITVNGAGTFAPRFAQNASNGTSSVLVGSYMKIFEIV